MAETMRSSSSFAMMTADNGVAVDMVRVEYSEPAAPR